VKGIGGLALRLTGLPAIWGLITTAVSALGGVLSFLLSPIGLIGAAFVAVGLLIWHFWEPIKAFFMGFFSGIWQALTPLRDAFSALSPVFSMVWNGIKQLWDWFKKLLSPMQTSKETLDKCASAGETFGKVFGFALQTLLAPLTLLMDGISWILQKLGLIPAGLDEAQKKANNMKGGMVAGVAGEIAKDNTLKDKINTLQGDISAITKPTSSADGGKPNISDSGTARRLKEISDNTKTTANNTKKIGPGDIVFKNLPQALALRGAYQEARVITQPVPGVAASAVGGVLSVPAATQGAVVAPVAASSGAPVFQINFNDVGSKSVQELEKMVRNAVRDAMATTNRANRGSFRDRD
jgi:hypothetical protein